MRYAVKVRHMPQREEGVQMKRLVSMFAVAAMVVMVMALAGCSSGAASSSASASSDASASASASAASESANAASSAASEAAALANGEYSAAFNTDSSMFHVNEANDGKGVLTVSDDGMTIHVSLVSKNIVNLYVGTAADAEADEAAWLQPTTDEVTYSDGTTEEVYGFDIPVPVIGEEFDVAILGEKGTWYDHKVSVSDPEAI